MAVGCNLFLVAVAVVYTVTLKVDPKDFEWLQFKPKGVKGTDAKVLSSSMPRSRRKFLIDSCVEFWHACYSGFCSVHSTCYSWREEERC